MGLLRGLILAVLVGGIALLTLPFLVSSLYIDQRGITIPGRVQYKREDVTVHYSAVKRSSEATVEYTKPDGSGVAFVKAELTPDEYDGLRLGQTVDLHYLRAQDVPDLPLFRLLRRAQLLPTARLASQHAFNGARLLFSGRRAVIAAAVGVSVFLLLVWRLLRIPGFAWAVAAFVVAGLAAVFVSEFPRPMPAPAVGVRQGRGRVKSVERIDRIFEESHSRGMDADQPIEVLGVEFTPEGRAESVVAVDLIDAGSVPGLREKSAVEVDYEGSSPRTAYVRGATRNFVAKNIAGMWMQALACVVVLIVLMGGAHLLGRGYNRLTRTR